MTIDPHQLRFVFQGMLDRDKSSKGYGQFQWRIGVLTPVAAVRQPNEIGYERENELRLLCGHEAVDTSRLPDRRGITTPIPILITRRNPTLTQAVSHADMNVQRLIATVMCAAPTMLSAAEAERPNFIVINIDDLGYADIGPFGSTLNRTPHLDRMAQEGRKLTSFYAAPVCSPSRAALMTGCYPKRALPIPHVLFPGNEWGWPRKR